MIYMNIRRWKGMMYKMKFAMDVVIYARYSSQRQNETSIEAQLEECHRYCKENGYNVIREYIDKEITGRISDRPQFLKMIEDSEKRLFEAVIVYQFDRFSRDKYDNALFKKKLHDYGVKVISIKEPVSEGASGILMEGMYEILAQYYSAELGQKVERNMDLNAKNGWFNGGNLILGYKKITVDCGNYNKVKVEIDPQIAPVIRECFEMRANDTKMKDILDFLNSKGYKTSRGNTFKKSTLGGMLKNKRYMGIVVFGGEEYPYPELAIVDKDLFERVQVVNRKYEHAPAQAKADEDYILTTKLFCGKCKAAMVGTSGTSHNGTIYKYYVCNKVLKKKCNKKNIPKHIIEDLVINESRKILTDDNISMIANKVYTICQKENAQTSLVKALDKQIKKINKSIENLMVALENGENVDLINQRITDKRVELEQTKKQYDLEGKKVINITEQQIKYFLLKIKDGDINDIKYRKTLVTLFVNKIYVYDDEVTIIFNVGEKPITITRSLLKEINTNLKNTKSSYIEQCSPPK